MHLRTVGVLYAEVRLTLLCCKSPSSLFRCTRSFVARALSCCISMDTRDKLCFPLNTEMNPCTIQLHGVKHWSGSCLLRYQLLKDFFLCICLLHEPSCFLSLLKMIVSLGLPKCRNFGLSVCFDCLLPGGEIGRILRRREM